MVPRHRPVGTLTAATARELVVLSASFTFPLKGSETAPLFTWSCEPRCIQSPMLEGEKLISTTFGRAGIEPPDRRLGRRRMLLPPSCVLARARVCVCVCVHLHKPSYRYSTVVLFGPGKARMVCVVHFLATARRKRAKKSPSIHWLLIYTRIIPHVFQTITSSTLPWIKGRGLPVISASVASTMVHLPQIHSLALSFIRSFVPSFPHFTTGPTQILVPLPYPRTKCRAQSQ